MKVPLLDLKAQYSTIKNELNEALIKVAESQYFILGPEVDKLEKSLCEYTGCKYSIGVSSGTDALLIALMAVGIKPGDEVIIPTYSFFATAGVISRLNAVPVFAEIDPVTYNIDTNKIETLITARTKAIIPVHLYGQSAEMNKMSEIANKYKLKVIEDAAQAIGVQYSDGRKAGTMGDIGCFSFFPSKNLGCFGDGGLVTTNNEEMAEKLKILRVHGSKPKYYHKLIGGNFRLDAIQAAVLNVKLPHLDNWSAKRRKNADLYNSLLISSGLAEKTGITDYNIRNKILLPEAVYKGSNVLNYHIYNQYVVRVEKRDELRKYLAEKDIGTEIYYPVPFHRQECFSELVKDRKYNFKDLYNADRAADESLALPVYPELSEEQIKYVAESIREFLKSS